MLVSKAFYNTNCRYLLEVKTALDKLSQHILDICIYNKTNKTHYNLMLKSVSLLVTSMDISNASQH